MSTPAEDIAQHLVTNGLGVIGENVFVSREPEAPINCVTVYDRGAAYISPKFRIDDLMIRVQVRDELYTQAMNISTRIQFLLVGTPRFTALNGAVFVGIYGITGLLPAPYNVNNRAVVIADYRVIVQNPALAQDSNLTDPRLGLN